MISDPLALFTAVTDALCREDWEAAAELCDPVSLAVFRRQLIEQFQPVEPLHELSVEQYLRHMPEMPREVAEYHVAQHNQQRDSAVRLAQEMPGVQTLDELASLSPEGAFALWLRGRSPRAQVEQMVARGQIAASDAQQMLDAVGPVSAFGYIAVGAIADGDTLAHIVYRWDVPAEPIPDSDAASWLARLTPQEQVFAREVSPKLHPQIVSCRRQPNGSWCALADYNFFGMGSFAYGVGLDESAGFDTQANDEAASE